MSANAEEVVDSIREKILKSDHFERTPELASAIDKNFKKLSSSDINGYIFTGNPSYLFSLHTICLFTDNILNSSIVMALENTNVCDVGAGDFNFSKVNQATNPDINFYGITAQKFSDDRADEKHVFANAEYLSNNFDVQFNFIFSQHAYIHFVDPIGSIENAYLTLKEKGFLMISAFSIPGLDEYIHLVIPYLQHAGYNVVGLGCMFNLYDKNKIYSFIIQKTADKLELHFPIIYDGQEDWRAKYRASDKLINFKQAYHSKQQYFDYCLAFFLRENIKDKKNAIDDFDSLIDLFSSNKYIDSSLEQRYYSILITVAKKIKDFNLLIENYQKNIVDANLKCTLPSFLCGNVELDHFLAISNCGFFSASPANSQIEVIELLACYHIVAYIQTIGIRQALEAMRLPYSYSQTQFDYYAKDSILLFPKIAAMSQTSVTGYSRSDAQSMTKVGHFGSSSSGDSEPESSQSDRAPASRTPY